MGNQIFLWGGAAFWVFVAAGCYWWLIKTTYTTEIPYEGAAWRVDE